MSKTRASTPTKTSTKAPVAVKLKAKPKLPQTANRSEAAMTERLATLEPGRDYRLVVGPDLDAPEL